MPSPCNPFPSGITLKMLQARALEALREGAREKPFVLFVETVQQVHCLREVVRRLASEMRLDHLCVDVQVGTQPVVAPVLFVVLTVTTELQPA